ncbi:hypothetical protein ACROYT_G040255 [Oculina patagonica]
MERTGLKVNTGKCKILRMNARNQDNITMNGEPVEDIDNCKYDGNSILEMRSHVERAGMDNISDKARRKRWKYIGHVLRKETDDDCLKAMTLAPEGKGDAADRRQYGVEPSRGKTGWWMENVG